MPRGSTTAKRLRDTVATQVNTNNDNIIVTASKRNPKQQKSNCHVNSQINGHAKNPHKNSASLSPPSTPLSTTDRNGLYMGLNGKKVDDKMSSGRVRTDSASSSNSSSESYQNASETPISENHRQIDVNATKNLAVHRDLGHLSFAITILRSCPLSDTLAILIVLLQIPPTFLSVIQLLFATLTFVPSTSVATSNFTYTDILQGTISTPTFTTILFLDFAVLLVWLFLWIPLQEVALDMVQAVIAITLGGASSCKGAVIKNIFWCFGIIGASHFFRTGSLKNQSFRGIISSNHPDTLNLNNPIGPVIRSNGRKYGLIRLVLGIHILTQGVVQFVWDFYARRYHHNIPSTNFGDSEAAKLAINLSTDTSISQIKEVEPSTILETKRTDPKTVMKNKDCTLARNHQPLWAALASTKIVMVKEYETSHAAAESAGANTTRMNNLGSAPFSSEKDKIWITYVGSDEISFSTSFFSTFQPNDQDEATNLGDSTIDNSKPFYVKVNNATWEPIKIFTMTEPAQKPGPSTRWSGVVFGLTPMSNYNFDFISTVDKSLIFSTSVRTLQLPISEDGMLLNAKNGTCSGSPYPALKTSIAQVSKKLEEDRQRQKSSRKELRAKLNSVRKEFERLITSIASTGGNDDKMRQKVQQSTLHMRQADEATAILITQIENIDSIPRDETSLYSESKNEIQSQREKHKNACSEINSRKQSAERGIQALKLDLSNLKQKSETRNQRLNILKAKYESILDANAKGFDEAKRRESEREIKRNDRAKIQAFYIERLQSINSRIFDGQVALQAVATAIETLLQVQKDNYPGHSPTLSSRNSSGLGGDSVSLNSSIQPGNYPWTTQVNCSNAFSGSGVLPLTSTTVPSRKLGSRNRDRSSSLLSNVSKFTQSSDNGPLSSFVGKKPFGWKDTLEDLKYSSASTNGSGSGAGSIGDLRSPVVLKSNVTTNV
ncbi:Ubiquitination network signaling protein acrB [Erysiphe neolycopersici]|uniref:Ubiquitination network signaling protein acrB n=1 Tax=Erysiphe neolycopersici TaxID=212602 RepID=A0A420I3F7_9PEZI|nr:Ubiquitination network signaling protein acrB [Erysiphe neolycopersici]